jgi:glucosamine-6-phosphate deaminase
MQPLLNEETVIVPYIASSRQELGQQAASDIAAELRERLARQPLVRVIFAAAPSQSEMLDNLVATPGIAWDRIIAFHMDEYLGLPPDAPQRFSAYLDRKLFSRVPFASIHIIQPEGDPQRVADNYAASLAEAAIDIVCCGIGANSHLAFNDPPANFDDPCDVKIVSLDDVCRQQQVDDLCFDRFDQVPTHAITLSVPRLLRADRIFCCVPGSLKSEAVRATLEGPISNNCPSSALRLHPNCKLYLDTESASGLIR